MREKRPATKRKDTEAEETLATLLALAREHGASDLHIGADIPPMVRLHGELRAIRKSKIRPDISERLLFSTLSASQASTARKERGIEVRLQHPEGTYRGCIIRQRLGWDGCFHVIPREVPRPEGLGLPEAALRLVEHRTGLVLISGPRGSGKTTTLAALIEHLNRERAEHIITVEDPVEYRIPSRRAIVSQRTVGIHTESFASALRVALREDPDVIAVGDLRDLETISMAVTAAETGHLVLACMNTANAVGTVARVIDAFPPDQTSQVRTMLAESLRGVISQRLVPRVGGGGRVLALELLVATSGVSSQIREDRLTHLRSSIQTGGRHGMRLLDQSLAELCEAGAIEPAVARRLAEQPETIPG